VIHTVGPIWDEGENNEDNLLADCYRHSLELAVQHGAKTIAFPAISTGIYGFPMDRAAHVAIGETAAFLRHDQTLDRVLLVCYGQEAYETFVNAAREVLGE